MLSFISGFLSHTEKIPIANLFKHLDKDKDGIISFPEFKYVAQRYNFEINDDELMNVIQGLNSSYESYFNFSDF